MGGLKPTLPARVHFAGIMYGLKPVPFKTGPLPTRGSDFCFLKELRRFEPHESKAGETIRGAKVWKARCGPGRRGVGSCSLAGLSFFSAASRWLLVRRARGGLDARGRLHLSAHATGKRRSRTSEARLHRDDALPE